MDIYQKNYQKILQLVPGVLELEEFVKLSAPGFMDLNVHVMHRHKQKLVTALSHYYMDASSDLVPELDFTIAMYTSR